MDQEVWKLIPDCGGHYEASSLGRIRTVDRVVTKVHRNGKVMNQTYPSRLMSCKKADKLGHLSTTLTVDGKEKTFFVHRLVLLTFVGPCPEGMECCHGNGKADDNALSNLRWDTHANNSQDRKDHGNYAAGDKHHMAKITNAIAMEIYNSSASGVETAAMYGVATSAVSAIRSGKIWGTVTGGIPKGPGKGWRKSA